MSDIRKVWPKEPLTAKRYTRIMDDGSTAPMLFAWWVIELFDGTRVERSDAEFAAAFVDAAVLTELIDAARETWEADQEQSGPSVLGHRQFDPLRIARALDALGSALAAFDAVMLPDTETPA